MSRGLAGTALSPPMKRWAIAGALVMVTIIGLTPSAGATAPERQTIIVTCDFAAGDECNFVAAGPVTGAGFDVPTGEDRQVGRSFHSVERFVLTSGSFAGQELLLRLNGVNKQEEFDPTTCTGSFSGTGNWKVVGGTGALADAKGHGTFNFEGGFQAVPADGECLDEGATGSLVAQYEGLLTLAPSSN